jgi:deoxyribonuclease-4
VPARKPSPVGAHVPVGGGLVTGALPYLERIGAQAVQFHAGNPRAWRPPAPDPVTDAAFAARTHGSRIPVFVHAPYLINFGSPVEATRVKSAVALEDALDRGRRVGARGVVVHAGSAVEAGQRDAAYKLLREALLPVLDGLSDTDPDVLVEPTAGGGQALAATVADLEPWLAAVDDHPRVRVCLDVCHLFAAGHDVASPGGMRTTLNDYVRAVGRGRLALVHANDSRDPLGSRRDRHANIGTGAIGSEPFAELFRHPSTRNVPIVVETPAEDDGQARDLALLKALRDR